MCISGEIFSENGFPSCRGILRLAGELKAKVALKQLEKLAQIAPDSASKYR